ncbi:MAG: hypothetical protein H6895_09535 [Defluviimonas sp.]|uniref:hypothetical protein n=1 Tax=Albidovulum sp. TaxID=1872424 RepID=UPI001DA58BDD|nr:hypothetical protein [Paracoccaceae bacterium]MCC0064315.1 hypothetical protein [Defluviimonas sp.]
MKAPGRPLFLARRSYRRRRLVDAMRLLPLLGLFLFWLPLLWAPATTTEPDTAAGGFYLFTAWAVLIVLAFLLTHRLGDQPQPGDDAEGASGPREDEGGG